ncbi:MAG: zinc metallopeptidase [Bacillota bacterium]|nr:zinc metallopeptidase [Bacillota bacterium]
MTMLLLIIAIILPMWAQFKVKSTFNKYIKVAASKGYTGADVAKRILQSEGLYDVTVEVTQGYLSDHYDPRHRAVRLSQEVYQGRSIAALGVAAHEVGHAIQHADSYGPLEIRSSLAPVASFSSKAAFPLILIGLFMGQPAFINFGIYFFVAVVFFQLVTLPVEFNASSRAVLALEGGGFLASNEVAPTKKVLSAAAFTYVAAALVGILELVRLILISRMLGGDE